MTIFAQPSISRAPSSPAPALAVSLDGPVFWLMVAALAGLSLPLRQAGLTPDVSWLLDMCQRMLAGETAYVDIFETTPPIPTLLYMPGALIAGVTGIGAGAAVYATCYLAVLFALFVSDRILPRILAGAGPSRLIIITPAAFILFFLCNDAFAQREYLAAALALPAACVFIRHAETGDWPSLGALAIAAFLAGLAAAIKPPLFIAPGIALAFYYFWRERSIVFLWRSGLIAAGVVFVALTAVSLLAFPAYLGGVTHLMSDIYVPLRSSPLIGLTSKEFIAVAACIAIALAFNATRKPSPAIAIFCVMALSFTAVYFVQGKYFPYHLYPASFFGGLALVSAVAAALRPRTDETAGSRRVFSVALALMLPAMAWPTYAAYDDNRPRMHDLSWAEDLHQPTALAISTNISISFPLAQEIGAVWKDRIHSQWIVLYAKEGLKKKHFSADQKAIFQSYYDAEIDRILDRIIAQKPDIIIRSLPDKELYNELLKRNPQLLGAYEPVAREGVIEILKRR